MAQALDSKEILEFKELMLANTIMVDTIYQLLIQKKYFTGAEFLAKMNQVQKDYHQESKTLVEPAICA
jgi:hypothetical protein